MLVGDTLFVNGPGRTWSHEDFLTTMNTMQKIVFRWPDETRFYAGHGGSGLIGEERGRFEAFVSRGWGPETQGDIVWE
jgi:hydroxyacylglutathione hydrolase